MEQTQMFDIEDLREMMKREKDLKDEAQCNQRLIAKLEQQISALHTDLEMKSTEIESQSNVSQREKENLEAKIKMIEEHNSTLKKEISKLRQNISALEIKQKEQHKKLKRYKHR